MHPTFEGAILILRDNLAQLRAAVDGLPAGALDWRPVPAANSIAVLATHSVTATRYLFSSAAGSQLSREEYLENDRTPSFQAEAVDPARLLAAIDTLSLELETLASGGSDATLAASLGWVASTGRTMTGAECLVHTAAHLSEHTGQAGLTRDLWLAQQS